FIVSIMLHSLGVISLYIFIHLLSKNRLASFLGALFFAINFSHNQAVTWLGTFEGVELATLFGLLSLILYLKYQKNKNSIYNISSYFLLLVSLLFKEIALV